jgi:predicted ATP-grasp superfamily ATP-dependent carboligase
MKKSVRKEKCIITFARSWNSVVATRCLGKHGVEVITGDNLYVAASNFSFYSRGFFRYPDPDKDPAGFIDKLVKVCKKHQADDTDLVLMPLHTDSFIVAANRERFAGLAKIVLPERSKIDLIGNKATLAKFCNENSIHTPKTVVIDEGDDFAAIAEAFPYPAFLKISDSNASVGLHKVDNAEEAVKYLNQDVKKFKLTGANLAILQQAVPGEDYCSTFLFEHGEIRALMTYHNILDYPRKSGMGALRETVDAAAMENIGARLLELVEWHGVAEIDFRWDGVNEPYLIEVNPRFWGGLGQSVESGVDYPYLLFRLAVDGHIDPVLPERSDVKTFNPCLMTMLLLQEFVESKDLKGELKDVFGSFKQDLKGNQLVALKNLTGNLPKALNPLTRLKAVGKLLKQNRGAVDELFKKRDPLPLLGLLYPLAVFVKNGKISRDLLVTGAGKNSDGEEQ